MRLKSISMALLLCAGSMAAQADTDFSGGITSGNLSVWRINENTGQVSLCSFDSKTSPASCAPWSAKEPANGDYHLIVGNDLLSVWRMNGKTGSVSLCEYKDIAKEPLCTPWN
jgi:6-phosphogluconolactonase (cycloisomerase 2 family)